jgi:hypothetical protein
MFQDFGQKVSTFLIVGIVTQMLKVRSTWSIMGDEQISAMRTFVSTPSSFIVTQPADFRINLLRSAPCREICPSAGIKHRARRPIVSTGEIGFQRRLDNLGSRPAAAAGSAIKPFDKVLRQARRQPV